MSIPLFDLSLEFQQLAETDNSEDMPEGSPQLDAVLDRLAEDSARSILAMAKLVMNLEAEADVLDQHARAVMAKVRRRRSRSQYLRSWMRLQMEALKADRLKDALVTVWLQKSAPSVHVLDEEAVPPEFRRAVLRLPYSLVPAELRAAIQQMDIDRTAIMELAKRTGEVPLGIAIESSRHLRIV